MATKAASALIALLRRTDCHLILGNFFFFELLFFSMSYFPGTLEMVLIFIQAVKVDPYFLKYGARNRDAPCKSQRFILGL